MPGIDLTDRIKMINMQHGHMPAVKHDEVKVEKEAEDKLQEALNEVDQKEPVILSRVGDMCDCNDLVAKVEELTAEIKKMNKHIISIQKYIKKNN